MTLALIFYAVVVISEAVAFPLQSFFSPKLRHLCSIYL